MIKFYYLIYLTDGTIHLKPFDTRDEAKKYKEKCDAVFEKKNRFLYSTITRRDLSKYDTPYWVH